MNNTKTNNTTSAFRQIMKGTAIFGGTQFITMISNIIRAKLVAVILGAFGMGISSLLSSVIQPIIQFFSLGIPMSSVSNIANSQDDEERIQRVIALRRCLGIMALLGCVFMISTSSLLAGFTSGKDSVFYNQGGSISHWFIGLGFVVLFTMLASGENAILQSYRAIGKIAKCNIFGALGGLLLGVPLYYLFDFSGIIYAMILLSVVTWGYTRWNTQSLNIRGRQKWSQTFTYGKQMMVLGITMMISGFLGNMVVYFVNTFINKYGGTTDVGFYQSANTITMQCTAMIFTALATDYYPHLTQLSSSMKDMKRLVNQEGEIVFLITAPIAALLIIFSPMVVRLLLTPEFDSITPLVQMMSLAFLMRAYYFPLDYICLAKQDKKYFFWVQGVWTNVKMILLFIGCYWKFGLIGLGYASILNDFIDIIMSTILSRWRYNVIYDNKMFGLSAFLLVLVSLILVSNMCYGETVMGSTLSVVLTITVVIYSVSQLNKRINFGELIQKHFNKE